MARLALGRRLARAQAAGGPPHALRVCELASPFLAKPIQMGFAASRNPPLSPPARARHCALVGGYMRREKAEQRPGLGAAAHWVRRHSSDPAALCGPLVLCAGPARHFCVAASSRAHF